MNTGKNRRISKSGHGHHQPATRRAPSPGLYRHPSSQEVSESSALCEGEGWAASLWGSPRSKGLSGGSGGGGDDDDGEREAAFGRLEPGKRPDTIVLRGVPANWLGGRGRAAEGTEAPVRTCGYLP